jgi:hypothetical protein
MKLFSPSVFSLLVPLAFSQGAMLPVKSGRLEWSRKLASNEIEVGHSIFYSNNNLFISDEKCNINIIDKSGNEDAAVNGSESLLCSAPLAFSPSGNFFLQTRLQNNEMS